MLSTFVYVLAAALLEGAISIDATPAEATSVNRAIQKNYTPTHEMSQLNHQVR